MNADVNQHRVVCSLNPFFDDESCFWRKKLAGKSRRTSIEESLHGRRTARSLQLAYRRIHSWANGKQSVNVDGNGNNKRTTSQANIDSKQRNRTRFVTSECEPDSMEHCGPHSLIIHQHKYFSYIRRLDIVQKVENENVNYVNAVSRAKPAICPSMGFICRTLVKLLLFWVFD